jgi:hypothetical protein
MLASVGCSPGSVGPEESLSASPIVHGRADRGRDPGVVALLLGNEGLCSATLIAPRAVLTARHCVSRLASEAVDCTAPGPQVTGEREASSLVVVTGDDVAAGQPVARGTRVLVPPTDRLCGADVAVVVLDREASGIQPVAVELSHAPHADQEVVAVGFGRTSDTSGAGVKERRDAVPIVSVAPSEFSLGESTCSGDSGGPALDSDSGAIVGVVSRGGPACVSAQARNIYTRVDGWAELIRQGITLGGGSADHPTEPTPVPGHTPDPAPSDPPPDIGRPCQAGEQCASGYCIRASHTCTVTCDAHTRCPMGYRCGLGSGGVHACFVLHR